MVSEELSRLESGPTLLRPDPDGVFSERERDYTSKGKDEFDRLDTVSPE